MSAPKSTILAVDDAEEIRMLLQATLGKAHDVKTAADADSALKLALEAPRPDLVLLDVEMPGTDGYELCKQLRAKPQLADVPVIFLTGRMNAQDAVQGFRLGAIDFVTKPFEPAALTARLGAHLELIAQRRRHEELVRERTAQLEHTRLQLIRRLARAMEFHESSSLGNRVVRLAHYTRAIAQAAGARDAITDLIMKAAPLHDIGKLGVPAEVLRKQGALTSDEREQIERHPLIGADIIGEHDDPLLKLARTLALTHHERWDGLGYPKGMKGADIPWAGRVMAVVDAFESMTAAQFHRAALPIEHAVAEIEKGAGTQFDPAMVKAFQAALPELRKIHESYADKQGELVDEDDIVIGGPAPSAPASSPLAEADRTLTGPLPLRGTQISDEARAKAARERAVAEAKAAEEARKRRNEDQAAALAAEERAAAELKAAQAAERRISAEARAEGKSEPSPQVLAALKRAQETLALAQKERTTAEEAIKAEKERTRLAEERAAAAEAKLKSKEADLAAAAALGGQSQETEARLRRAQEALAAAEQRAAAAEAQLKRKDEEAVIGAQATDAEAKLRRAEEVLAEAAEQRAVAEEALRAVSQPAPANGAALRAEKERAAAAEAALRRKEEELGEAQKERAAAQQARAAAEAALKRKEAESAAAAAAGALSQTAEAEAQVRRARETLAEAQKERSAAEQARAAAEAALKRKEEELAQRAATPADGELRAQLERAHAELVEARGERDALEAMLRSLAQAKPAAPESAETHAELARLQAALAELEGQHAATELALSGARAEVHQAKAALAEAQKERQAFELTLASVQGAGNPQMQAELERARAALAEAEQQRRAAEEALQAERARETQPSAAPADEQAIVQAVEARVAAAHKALDDARAERQAAEEARAWAAEEAASARMHRARAGRGGVAALAFLLGGVATAGAYYALSVYNLLPSLAEPPAAPPVPSAQVAAPVRDAPALFDGPPLALRLAQTLSVK